MVQVRDKKKAYVEGSGEGAKVLNWKHELLGYIHWEDNWCCYVVQWLPGTYTGSKFLKSLASQMEDMEQADLAEEESEGGSA